ncbi:MAG TPA: LuxR C-terminal-related transcriptional regulator [Gemmatimonadaceae bacterium]|nr:LuxR C-terminal-related transcriptional regulator [Gemmatimonadaceae bacterium]
MLEAELERARECCRRREWSKAHRLLSLADQATTLAAEDLERLATSAYMIGRDLDFHRYLERVHYSHLRDDDECRAARSAFWLGLTLMFRGETGQANGWLARARRLVEGRDCVENGYLLLPVAEQRLAERDSDSALAAATDAAEIGERFGDADLTACARHLQGRALIQQGQVPRGLALLDEAMIAVCGGQLSPIITGLIYCSVIDSCQQVFASSRAREWTSALARWCEQQLGTMAFTVSCLIRRAEVMQFDGAWSEAMTEASHAYERSSQAGERKPPSAAFYRQGEIHRLWGEFEAAEEAYRNASRLGSEPQPGLALLRMAQGHTDSACTAIRRVLSAATDPLQRAKLLPAFVEIALVAGNMQEARDASAELDEIARRYSTDVLQAMAAHVRGAVELAEGHARDALIALRHAFELWRQAEAPYETARVRVLIALASRELGDVESADLEIEAAAALFERLGATADLAQLDTLRKGATQVNKHGLTPRELQVLRQIAAGKTNRAMAANLSVSERTIDRHVSNILVKLGVPSRAAATAYAYSHKLL